jgi:hypothetical protein
MVSTPAVVLLPFEAATLVVTAAVLSWASAQATTAQSRSVNFCQNHFFCRRGRPREHIAESHSNHKIKQLTGKCNQGNHRSQEKRVVKFRLRAFFHHFSPSFHRDSPA